MAAKIKVEDAIYVPSESESESEYEDIPDLPFKKDDTYFSPKDLDSAIALNDLIKNHEIYYEERVEKLKKTVRKILNWDKGLDPNGYVENMYRRALKGVKENLKFVQNLRSKVEADIDTLKSYRI